jgi:hypothetical protein
MNSFVPDLKPALAALLCLFALAAPPRADGQDASEHLKITLELSSDTIAAGGASEILLSFHPKKGFHVNAVPPVGFALDSGSVAALADTVVVARDTGTGYLDVRSKVRQPFTVAKTAPRGRSELKGQLTYYYCSDEEGWCRREKLPFSLPVILR